MNRNRPERRSGAATRFDRRDLSDPEAGGFERLIFKPPPNGLIFRCEAASCRGSGPPGPGGRDYLTTSWVLRRGGPWQIARAQWPPGRGMPPGFSEDWRFNSEWPREGRGLSPPCRFGRPRESIAGTKVTFSRDDAEMKVTFIRGLDLPLQRPRESIQNRSGPVGISPPSRFSRPRESIAGTKVTFSMDDAEKKVTFSRGTRPPGVGQSGGHGSIRRWRARCAVDRGSRPSGEIMGERFLRIRRGGVLYPC